MQYAILGYIILLQIHKDILLFDSLNRIIVVVNEPEKVLSLDLTLSV